MTLKDQLLEDLKDALRNKDNIRKNVIQMVRSAVLQAEKDNRISLDDDGVTNVIAKELKKRKDALPQYEQSGRQDLVDDLKREIELLTAYLPEQMGEEEIKAIIKEAIRESGAQAISDLGKVMKEVMPKVRGKADGRIVSDIAGRILKSEL